MYFRGIHLAVTSDRANIRIREACIYHLRLPYVFNVTYISRLMTLYGYQLDRNYPYFPSPVPPGDEAVPPDLVAPSPAFCNASNSFSISACCFCKDILEVKQTKGQICLIQRVLHVKVLWIYASFGVAQFGSETVKECFKCLIPFNLIDTTRRILRSILLEEHIKNHCAHSYFHNYYSYTY